MLYTTFRFSSSFFFHAMWKFMRRMFHNLLESIFRPLCSVVLACVFVCVCECESLAYDKLYTHWISCKYIQTYGWFYPLLSSMNVEAKSSSEANEASKQLKQKVYSLKTCQGCVFESVSLKLWYLLVRISVCLYVIKLFCCIFLDTHTIWFSLNFNESAFESLSLPFSTSIQLYQTLYSIE